MKQFSLIPALVIPILFFSFMKEKPHANISIWTLFYNDKKLISSQDFMPGDTTIIISLDPGRFEKRDSVRFHWSFDVLGKIEYLTRLYLAAPGQKNKLVSEKKSVDHCSGSFAVSRMKQMFDSCHCDYMQLLADVDEHKGIKLLKLKLSR